VIEPAAIEQSYRDPFGVLPRPTIAEGGDKRTCPIAKQSPCSRHTSCSIAKTHVVKLRDALSIVGLCCLANLFRLLAARSWA